MYLREILVYIAIAISLFLSSLSIYFHYHGGPNATSKSAIVPSNVKEINDDSIERPAGKTESGIESYIMGIDVSHWDGNISWVRLKQSGVQFAYIKATEGSEYVDPNFTRNWIGASDAGVIRGAYHFFAPNDDPILQAEHFLRTVSNNGNDLVPVLDIEVAERLDPAKLRTNILLWLQTVEKKLGVKPIIYTDNGFWEAHVRGNFASYDLWIADWQAKTSPILPAGWSDWVFWQYSVKGRVDGIDDPSVDLDYFKGTRSELKRIQSSSGN